MTEGSIIKILEKYHTYIDNNKAELHSDSYHEVAQDILQQINLTIPIVGEQRELLITFIDWATKNKMNQHFKKNHEIVESFIESNL